MFQDLTGRRNCLSLVLRTAHRMLLSKMKYSAQKLSARDNFFVVVTKTNVLVRKTRTFKLTATFIQVIVILRVTDYPVQTDYRPTVNYTQPSLQQNLNEATVLRLTEEFIQNLLRHTPNSVFCNLCTTEIYNRCVYERMYKHGINFIGIKQFNCDLINVYWFI